jgi:hypothetical protein
MHVDDGLLGEVDGVVVLHGLRQPLNVLGDWLRCWSMISDTTRNAHVSLPCRLLVRISCRP